jgi:hypothetical protein
MPVVTRRIDKKKAGNTGWWSDKERIQAVNAYVILGKVTLVAASTGIPEDTLRKWKMASWWKEAEDEIRRSNKIELSGKLSNIVTKTLEQLEDRVTNGDFFYNPKLGTFERKGISAQQASKITVDLIDKTLLLEKSATEERITEEGLDLRLKKLKEEMIRFAKAKTINGVKQDELLSTSYVVVHEEAAAATTSADCADNDGGNPRMEGSSDDGGDSGSPSGNQPTPAEGGDGCPGIECTGPRLQSPTPEDSNRQGVQGPTEA